jgi:hypothetical protein
MIREALDEHARATARVFEDRANTVGGSEIGQCARKIYFTKNEGDPVYGASPDGNYADGWGARVRGTIFENHFWVPALRAKFGDRLLFAGEQQETFALGFLSSTPDGLLVALEGDELTSLGVPDSGGDGSLIVECKTADPRTKLDGPKLEHVYQAQVQLGLIRELTRHRPEFALISYVNASFWDEVAEFAVKFDPQVFANAQQRAAEIMTARAPDELKPEGWIAGGKECEHCAFLAACGRLRHAVPTQAAIDEPDPQFVAEIADLARAAKARRREAEAATARQRDLDHQIRERLRGRGLRRVAGDGVTVTWSAVKGRPSYDMPAIREAAAKAGIDVSEFETVGDPTDRLTITIQTAAAAVA